MSIEIIQTTDLILNWNRGDLEKAVLESSIKIPNYGGHLEEFRDDIATSVKIKLWRLSWISRIVCTVQCDCTWDYAAGNDIV